ASHVLVPPHPGPLAAVEKLEANLGKTILYSILVGFPTALLSGPMLCKLLARRTAVPLGGLGATLVQKSERKCLPGFGSTLFTILLPVLLMMLPILLTMLTAFSRVTFPKENPLR